MYKYFPTREVPSVTVRALASLEMTVTILVVAWLPSLVISTQITFSHISSTGVESPSLNPRDMFINSKFGNIISHRSELLMSNLKLNVILK